jgi:hypothetical protein
MPFTPALMPAVRPTRLNRRRAIMTNDPRRLNGIDMRTSAGRRYRDIVDQLATEFGAVNPIALRELAGLRFPLSPAAGLHPREGAALEPVHAAASGKR